VRRPLPPELVVLGDQLEAAARRSVSIRHTRRQAILNAVASLLIALPLLPAVLGIIAPPVATDTVVERNRPGYGAARDDFPPRILRGAPSPSGDMLAEPSTLRRALR
jgi:hypothetical protein